MFIIDLDDQGSIQSAFLSQLNDGIFFVDIFIFAVDF